MLERGWEVLCLDNLVTGSETNIAHLMANPKFRFARHDVSRFIDVPGPVEAVLHFASRNIFWLQPRNVTAIPTSVRSRNRIGAT